MGGVNHQPCNHYLGNSTRMSRWMSLARSSQELGNVSLEDALLSELSGHEPTVVVKALTTASKNLRRSSGQLRRMKESVLQLHHQMTELEYQDLPTLKTVDLDDMTMRLGVSGMACDTCCSEIIEMLLSPGGFFNVLKSFNEKIDDLIDKTDTLISKFPKLVEAANRSSLGDVLEKNLDGNIKIEFAVLYHSWCNFQQLFLASSMISTHLWYQHTNRGELIQSSALKQ